MIHGKESRRRLDCPETGKEIRCTLISFSSSLSTVTKTHMFIDEKYFQNSEANGNEYIFHATSFFPRWVIG